MSQFISNEKFNFNLIRTFNEYNRMYSFLDVSQLSCLVLALNYFSGSGRVRAYCFGFRPVLVGPFTTLCKYINFESRNLDKNVR